MQRTCKFRLYPTKEQEQKLLWTLEKCRLVYNQILEGLNKQEKPNKLSPNLAELSFIPLVRLV